MPDQALAFRRMNSALRVILNLRVRNQILPPSKNLRIRKAENGRPFPGERFRSYRRKQVWNSSDEILRKVRQGHNVTHDDMNNRSCQLFMLITCICAVSHSLDAQTPEPGNLKEFIYVLRLVPRLYDDTKWTKEDNAALDRHFIRFQEAVKSGQLILAGRTKEAGDKTFGIAIFRASDEAAARKFMESDPAVVAKLMTAELHPFSVALQRKAP